MTRSVCSTLLSAFALIGALFGTGAAARAEERVTAPVTNGGIAATSPDDGGNSSGGNTAPWKGHVEQSDIAVGALAGAGIIDARAGFVTLITASAKVLKEGFLDDEVADAVSLELQGGPLFISGTSAFQYSAHVKWDFRHDAHLGFYAIGGVGGHITSAALGSRFILLPRFGAGTTYKIAPNFDLRAEVSHETIAVGVAVPLFF